MDTSVVDDSTTCPSQRHCPGSILVEKISLGVDALFV
jgi:hypothetical protein